MKKAWPGGAAAIVGGKLDDPNFRISEGAKPHACYNCGCEIWINAATARFATSLAKREFVCISCYKLYETPTTTQIRLREKSNDTGS